MAKKFFYFIFTILLIDSLFKANLFAHYSQAADPEKTNLIKLYLSNDFNGIVKYFKYKDYKQLPIEDRLLWVECLARTDRRMEARAKLQPLLNSFPENPEVLAAAGIVYFSLGHFKEACQYIDLALKKNPDSQRAIISKIIRLLFRRSFKEAERYYNRLIAVSDNAWKKSELLFHIGLDVYRGLREPQKLRLLYEAKGEEKKKTDEELYKNLKATSKMINNAKNRKLFQDELSSGAAVFPFLHDVSSLRINTIQFVVKKKVFRVLLDTGNATGCTVHSVELNELLKPKRGGQIAARIGAESSSLLGYNQYYKMFDFGKFHIRDLIGVYVPKPSPEYPDVNFNPAFIDNHISTLDFIQNRFILRTEAEFAGYIQTIPEENISVFPWYGDKYVFIPVKVDQNDGLAMLETGAADIALKLDFARKIQMAMNPEVKYLGNGSKVSYFKSQTSVRLGKFLFRRENAEVWEFKDFHNPIKCFSPDVIIGPDTFRDKYSVSLNPLTKEVIIIKEK